MSTMRRSPVILGISLLLASVGLVWAQPADPLEQARLELKIKEQKLLKEISANLAEARSLSRSNPSKSYDILSQTKSWLTDDISLPDRQRKDLLDQVNTRLKDASSQMKAQKAADDLAAAQAAEKVRLEKSLAAADLKATASGITPSMVINSQQQMAKLQLNIMKAYFERMKKQQDDTYYGTADKATPKYKEIEIMKMLNSTMTVDFQDITIKKALEYIEDMGEKNKLKLNILYDDPALKEAMIDVEEKKTTLKMTKFSVRQILKKMFEAEKLDYYIEDGALRITTAENAQKKMVIRFYPARYLVSTGGGGMMPPMMAMMQQMQAKQSAQSLALLMMSLVEPTSYWFINGGPGQVDWDAKSMSLAIKASVEMHYLVKASGVLDNNRLPGQPPPQP